MKNLDKEVDDIVAPLPSKKETHLTIAVVVLGVIIIVIAAFGAGYYWSGDQPQQQQAQQVSEQVPVQTTSSSAVDLKIKGNKNSKIYHLPNCASYDRIKDYNIIWFKTKEEAEAAGYRMAKNC